MLTKFANQTKITERNWKASSGVHLSLISALVFHLSRTRFVLSRFSVCLNSCFFEPQLCFFQLVRELCSSKADLCGSGLAAFKKFSLNFLISHETLPLASKWSSRVRFTGGDSPLKISLKRPSNTEANKWRYWPRLVGEKSLKLSGKKSI